MGPLVTSGNSAGIQQKILLWSRWNGMWNIPGTDWAKIPKTTCRDVWDPGNDFLGCHTLIPTRDPGAGIPVEDSWSCGDVGIPNPTRALRKKVQHWDKGVTSLGSAEKTDLVVVGVLEGWTRCSGRSFPTWMIP